MIRFQSRSALRPVSTTALTVLLALGCGRFGYEPYDEDVPLDPSGVSDSILLDNVSESPSGSDPSDAGEGLPDNSEATGGTDAVPDGGTAPQQISSASTDAGSPSPLASDAGSGPLAAPDAASSADCSAMPGTDFWRFDTNLAGWVIDSPVATDLNAAWDSGGGVPGGSGLARLEGNTAGDSAFFNLPLAATDLSGRVLSARAYVEAGTNVGLKPYAQSGVDHNWADGGRVDPAQGQWVCLSFDLNGPEYESANFDATKVVEIGLQIRSDTDFTVYVDEVRH